MQKAEPLPPRPLTSTSAVAALAVLASWARDIGSAIPGKNSHTAASVRATVVGTRNTITSATKRQRVRVSLRSFNGSMVGAARAGGGGGAADGTRRASVGVKFVSPGGSAPAGCALRSIDIATLTDGDRFSGYRVRMILFRGSYLRRRYSRTDRLSCSVRGRSYTRISAMSPGNVCWAYTGAGPSLK